jgi:hypothetical protein
MTGGGSGGSGSSGCVPPPVNNPPSYVVNPDIDVPPSCVFISVSEDGLACHPSCSATAAEGGVACLAVQREPYPRGLVGVPNVFVVSGPYSKDGNTVTCPNANVPDDKALNKNRTLQVIWRMDMRIPPNWFWDERPWNISAGVSNQGTGFVAEHTYETSSFPTYTGDKPSVGPSTTNELLPAYLVRVDTWWRGYVKREWDQYAWVDKHEKQPCNPNQLRGDPGNQETLADAGICVNESGSWVQDVVTGREYVFQGHQSVEDEIDLRTWGWPTSELYSRHAWDPRQSVAGIPPQYICRYIPTPILESQSVVTTNGGSGP